MEKVNKKIGVVRLSHPETAKDQEFTTEHAQAIIDMQIKRNMRPEQCWKLNDKNFILTNGKITGKSDN